MAEDGASAKRADAPAPDDERKPHWPPEVSGRSWRYVLRKTFREFGDDECPDRAAALTYYGVLALFPGLLAFTSLLAIVGQGDRAVDALFDIVEQVAPGGALDVIREPLEDFSDSPAAGIGFVTGLVIAIWSASGYVGAFSRAMNRIYEIDEGRPFWKLRPMQLGVTIIVLLLIVVIAVTLVLSGPVVDAIGSALGISEAVQIVWEVAKWPLLAFAVIFMIALLYYATPNAKQPKFRWISLGAVIAIVVLLIASAGFALYVANFSNYDRTYGSLAG
ncbi:MAG TPA: YihY/virulence factor BrkB family protein, partial [Agromyces sp.]|nr:YihY/virulence factor BrkB family protein [Agromyces sp.]